MSDSIGNLGLPTGAAMVAQRLALPALLGALTGWMIGGPNAKQRRRQMLFGAAAGVTIAWLESRPPAPIAPTPAAESPF